MSRAGIPGERLDERSFDRALTEVICFLQEAPIPLRRRTEHHAAIDMTRLAASAD
jgi:hypothetical protein